MACAEGRRLFMLVGLFAGALLAAPSCGLFGASGPSRVGRGLRYEPGHPSFDAFFADLHALQVKLDQAPEEERQLRRKLSEQLEVEQGATINVLAQSVSERAQKLSDNGLKLRTNVEGYDASDPADTAVSVVVSGGKLYGKRKDFVEAVGETAREALRLMARLRSNQRQLEKLHARAIGLEGEVDEAFRLDGPGKRSEVANNLEDAQKLISLMIARANEVADTAKDDVKRLADALTTAGAQAPDVDANPVIVEGSDESGSKPTPPPKSRPKQRRRPAPKPKPKQPAPPPSDFEP